MFENGTWSPVPGTSDVQLLPLIRKPSILCSNAYLLSAPGQTVIVDPGADARQVEEIQRVLASVQEASDGPVFVYLSHCHIDHLFALPALLEAPLEARLLCHQRGVRALIERDRVLTVADLHALEVPDCPVWAALFEPGEPEPATLPRFHPFEEMFQTGRLVMADGRSVPTHRVALGVRDRMEVFPTPGHSPDGIGICVGRLLFVGDLPFATDIGVAGAMGWDPEALAGSLELLKIVGRERDIEWVLPGHGRPFPFRQLEEIIQRQQKELQRLSNLIPLDRERLLDLLDYANAVLDEISAEFAVVSARLLKTAHWLELLDEEEAATGILRAVDMEAAEGLIDEFHAFVESFRGAELKNVILVRALHFMGRFDRTFSPESVAYLLTPLLLRRVRTLFSEFYHAVYGFRFALPEEGFLLREAVEEALSAAREPLCSDRAFLEASGADQTFLEALASRIADHPVFDGVHLDLQPDPAGTVPVSMDRTLFQDLLLTLLERLAARGYDRIELTPGQQNGKPLLRVSAEAASPPSPLGTRRLEILRRTMQNHGGDLRQLQDGPPALFVFSFPPAHGS
jgi:glyoxylase-like metal-dependent hydrolase (beta-lactamase superfamily II)